MTDPLIGLLLAFSFVMLLLGLAAAAGWLLVTFVYWLDRRTRREEARRINQPHRNATAGRTVRRS